MEYQKSKNNRILDMAMRLKDGKVLRKKEESLHFGVTEKSIQRDIETLRDFFDQEPGGQMLIYDKRLAGYRLDTQSEQLSNSEIFAVCKILLESRSLPKTDMNRLLDKLLACCVPDINKKKVDSLIGNERYHYIEPHHGISVLDRLWKIGTAVQEHLVMQITYCKLKQAEPVQRVIEPVGIMFSEYYFYLIAFIRRDKKPTGKQMDKISPTIYRIDRIQRYFITNEHFQVCYAQRFEEGEFRKRVQFMHGGELQTVRFRYIGPSLEAVLDRLPTAEAKKSPNGGWNVEAEVFGQGAYMWLRSQGDYVILQEEKSWEKWCFKGRGGYMKYIDIFQSKNARLNFLKGIIRLAKADKVIEPEEQMYFRAAGAQLELTQADLDEVDQYWRQDELPVTFETQREKVLFLREALQLCAVDDRYPEEERQEIRKVAAELGILIELVEQLEAWVEEGMRWKQRGDEFLNV